MNIDDMEQVIISHGIPLQSVLHAAFTIEDISTIGGNSCMGQGSGRAGDPAHMIDRAISVTRHIRDGEHDRLRRWVLTDNVEPREWPRNVLTFWGRVPYQAAKDLAAVTGSVV